MNTASSRSIGSDRRRMRVASAVLCALFVLAQIATFAHEALIAHGVCAEHGELIHVAHAASVVGTTASASRHALAPHARPTAPRTTPEHEHCGLAMLSRQRSLQLDDCASVGVAQTPSDTPMVVASVEEHASIPLLLLAPKQSPPL